LGNHRGIREPKDRQRGGKGLFQRDLQGRAIQSFQPLDLVHGPLHERVGPLDTAEEFGFNPTHIGREKTGEGVDKILGRHLASMMELDPRRKMKVQRRPSRDASQYSAIAGVGLRWASNWTKPSKICVTTARL